MVTYATNTDLSTQYFSRTRIWAGTATNSFFVNDPIMINSGVTVRSNDSTVVTNRLGQHSGAASDEHGTLVLTNSTIDLNSTAGANTIGGSTNTSFTFSDVKQFYSNPVYSFIGNFHTRTSGAPTYIWNNFQVEGEADTSRAQCYMSWFTGAINRTASSFNNVSFWNNETGANARGGVWQTTSGAIYNNSILGPFGVEFNSVGNTRMIARFSNQGDTSITQTNHAGLATNYDFRALGQLNTTNTPTLASQAWYIDVDTGGHMYFLNWLPGRPDAFAAYGFVNIFNNATLVGGQAHVCVGTKAQLGTGDHILTFASADADQTTGNGIFLQRGAWDVDAPPTYLTNTPSGRSVTDYSDVDDAIIFRDQHYDRSTETGNVQFSASIGGQISRLQTINNMTVKQYRKYSWLQQPNDAQFGKTVSVTPPAFNESDTQIAARRTAGYDDFNGTTWQTTTDVSDTIDPVIAQTGVASRTLANFAYGIAGGTSPTARARTVSDIAAMMKAYQMNLALNPDAANTRVSLGYSIDGNTLDVGGDDITLSGIATEVTVTGVSPRVWRLPVGNLAPDATLNTLRTTGNILSESRGAPITTTANLIDRNAPTFTFSNFQGNVRMTMYDVTGGIPPVETTVDTARFINLTGLAVNGRITGATAGVPANWSTAIIRVVISSPTRTLFTQDYSGAGATDQNFFIDYNNLQRNTSFSADANVGTGTRALSVFNDTSAGSSGTKLLVDVTNTQLGDTPTNRVLQEFRGTTEYNDIVAINSIGADFISGIGLTGTQVDLRYFKAQADAVDQFFTGVSDAQGSANVRTSGDGDRFSTSRPATLTINGDTIATTLTVQNRQSPTGISGDAFDTGLTTQTRQITNLIEPLY